MNEGDRLVSRLERWARFLSIIAVLICIGFVANPRLGISVIGGIVLALPPMLALLALARNTSRWLDWAAFIANLVHLIVAIAALLMIWLSGLRMDPNHPVEALLNLFVLGVAPALVLAALGSRSTVGKAAIRPGSMDSA